ncbi:VIT and VWA domain-containing protein [Clostridium sp. UBA1056]|uniref:VIT and vWA domain-containing protein n=1 Tax=unclassified Clostridium TaxID=2614128 RepID=UPI003216603F
MEYGELQNSVSHGEITLKKVDIEGNICGEFVEFTISHIYENIGEDDVKGIYTFPIPDTAVISGFEANIGGRVIKGKVEDKKGIEKIYENVGEDSGSKLLLEELNKNYFKMSIGTILKGETVVIKISYIEELVYEQSKLKLIIPKIVPPVNPYSQKQQQQDEYNLSLNLLVETFENAKFYCDTHKIKVEEGENNLYKITLEDDNQILNSAMTIYLEESLSETSGIIYENYSEDNGIVYLRFLPEIEEDVEGKSGNYIFLIDISESMDGDKIKEAKTALQLCLRNLYKGDTFNIVAMGDTLKYFSANKKVEFNEENLKEASKWIDKLSCEKDASIFEGIKYAFLNEGKGEENTIILFTDDIVDDEKEILDYVEKTCVESRIFPFGIDASVNTYFINQIARLTFGKAEFINRSIRIEDVILNQFNRIRGLQITGIEIDWGGMKVEKTYPRTIEYMYDGEPFSIFAKIDGELDGIVTLNGMVGNRRIQRRISLTKLDLEVNANLIEKVWYKKRIESLENRVIYERGEVHEAMKSKIIELSTYIGIISDETSFILIEEIYEPVLGGVMRKFLPVNVDFNKGDTNIISPKFYYSQSLDELELDTLNDEGTDKSEFLRILATQQLASGAFGKSVEDDEIDKVIYTARSILAFTIHGEGIDIYKNLLTKAIVYLLENYEKFVSDKEVLILTYLALKSFADKVIVKDNKKVKLLNAINSLEDLINELNIDLSKIKEQILKDIEGAKEKDQLSRLIYKSIK